MRTTIDIPDALYRQMKEKAAREGTTVKKLILSSVEAKMGSVGAPKSRIKVPVIKSKRPGTLKLTNEQIYEMIDFP